MNLICKMFGHDWRQADFAKGAMIVYDESGEMCFPISKGRSYCHACKRCHKIACRHDYIEIDRSEKPQPEGGDYSVKVWIYYRCKKCGHKTFETHYDLRVPDEIYPVIRKAMARIRKEGYQIYTSSYFHHELTGQMAKMLEGHPKENWVNAIYKFLVPSRWVWKD